MKSVHRLAVASASAALLVFGAGRLLERYTRGHFIPHLSMDRAVGAGAGCVVAFGDSRVHAGFAPTVFERWYQQRGERRCAVNLGLGGTRPFVQYLTLRHYLDVEKARPAAVVIGVALDNLLEPTDRPPPDPDGLVGSEAVAFAWSKPSDVRLLYPEWPFQSLDPGLRFVLSQSSPLAIYRSVVWIRVQQSLGQSPEAAGLETNRFGAVSGMRNLSRTFVDLATHSLAVHPRGTRFNPAFVRMLELLKAHRVHAVLAEVPMPSAYHAAVRTSPAYDAAMRDARALVERRGGSFIAAPPTPDSDFGDGLHLGDEGAQRYTTYLAEQFERIAHQAPPDRVSQ